MSVRVTKLTSGSSTLNQAAYTTASIAPHRNRLILCAFAAAGTHDDAPTITGNGLTWVRVEGEDFPISVEQHAMAVYRAMGGNPSAGAVTITLSDWADSIYWSICEFDGVLISGDNGSDAVVQAVSGRTDQVLHYAIGLDQFESPYNVAYVFFGLDTHVYDIVPGSGLTEIHQGGDTTPFIHGMSAWKGAPETDLSGTMAGGNDVDWGGVGIEIGVQVKPPRKGVLNPDLKSAMAKHTAFAVFEFDDPGATTHRYAGEWTTSDSLGKYKGFVEDGGFGQSPRSVPLRGDRLQSISTTVTVIDKDETIKGLRTGEHSRQLRGMAARIRIVAPDILADAFHLRFVGEVLNIRKVGADRYTFELGANLSELEGYLNVPIITRALWPDADRRALGKRAPLVYGVHSSASLGSRGMLPTLYVDTSGYRYLVAHQFLDAITNVYVDHVVQGSGWAIEYLELEGHRYTLVDFDADQESSTITVDAKGAVFTGDVDTYTVEQNAAAQFKYILANYCFHSWNGKPEDWHDESDSAISETLFSTVEQFFNFRRARGSASISEQMTKLEFINLWASEFVPVFWTPDAKIGVRTDDWYYTRQDWTDTLPRLEESEHFIGEMNYDLSDEILADEWNIGFLYSAADTEALERIRVKDTLRGWNVSEHVDLLLSESTLINERMKINVSESVTPTDDETTTLT